MGVNTELQAKQLNNLKDFPVMKFQYFGSKLSWGVQMCPENKNAQLEGFS